MRERIMKILFIIFVITMIIVAMVIVRRQNQGKTQNNQVAEEKKYVNELRIGISALDNFDPILSKNKNVQDVCKLIYEPLVQIDTSYKLEGVLALEWAKTTENSYVIKLKQGIKFGNGDELTGIDIEKTINKIKSTDSSAYKENVKNITSVIVIDNYTVRIELAQEESLFEYNLIFPIQHIVDDGNYGTGLYKIYQSLSNRIDLVRNQFRENVENMKIKSIVIKTYGTMGELYNDFKIGNLDIITTDNIKYTDYIGTLGYIEKNFYGRNFDFLAMNLNNTVLYNAEVRKAISYAIDKNEIVSTVFNNKYYVANYPLDYGNWLYNQSSTSSGYNPEQSKKILENNGWTNTNGIWQKNDLKLQFNLLVNSNDEYRVKTAENIKKQLDEIGIKIHIVKVSDTSSYIANKNYELALLEMKMGVSPDLSRLFGMGNLFDYSNEEMLENIESIKNIEDENILKEKYAKMVEIYKSDIPFISLFFSNSVLIYSSKIVGNISPTWYNIFYNIENWTIEE